MTDRDNEHETERDHEHGYGQVPRHGGWEPVPHGGEYEPDATAFVQLPPDMDMMGAPLAAPGHGYVPPMIVPLTPAAATDPGATGVWRIPTELTGQCRARRQPRARRADRGVAGARRARPRARDPDAARPRPGRHGPVELRRRALPRGHRPVDDPGRARVNSRRNPVSSPPRR